jgi:hypothetical protein
MMVSEGAIVCDSFNVLIEARAGFQGGVVAWL